MNPKTKTPSRQLAASQRAHTFPAGASGLPQLDPRILRKPPLALMKLTGLFHASTGLDVVVVFRSPATGAWEERPLDGQVHAPRFCQLVGCNPRALARCAASRRDMVRQALKTSSQACHVCHAGLSVILRLVMVRRRGPGAILA